MNDTDPFVGWLEAELKRELGPVTARRRRASRPLYLELVGRGRARRMSLLGGASTALVVKIASGLTVAAFAVGATGTALSGTANPYDWRHQVGQRVEECQAGLSADGRGGIAGCVGVFAGHAPEPAASTPTPTPAETSASEARENPMVPPPAAKITVIPKAAPTVTQPAPGQPAAKDSNNRKPPLPDHRRGPSPLPGEDNSNNGD